jgi:hypothetical protein
MKKALVAAAVVALGILVWLVASRTPPASAPSESSENLAENKSGPEAPAVPAKITSGNGESHSAPPTGRSQPAADAIHSTTASTTATTPPTDEAAPAFPPDTVLDNCRVVIHHYNDTFGENPIGSNAEIVAALTGKNSRQINFIRADAGLRLNDQGELLDGWGTPFFFHQVSADTMEIRSAGQDRKLWTFDDLVTR